MDSLTVKELIELFFQFVRDFGLPFAMFAAFLYYLKRGEIMFKVTHDAEVAALKEHMKDMGKDRERLWNIAEPMTSAVERVPEVIRETVKRSS